MAKIVGICGPSFCGSTLLNTMLGTLPGVVSLGETHWILDPLTHHEGQHKGGRCVAHGDNCPVWPPNVISRIRADAVPSTLFQRLAEVVPQAQIICTADKNAIRWRKQGLPDMAVFPFKTPEAMLHSYLKRGHTEQAALAGLVAEWGTLFQMTERTPRVSISLEALIHDPEPLLRRLCQWLGVIFDTQMLTPWDSDQCFFGGNPAWPLFGGTLSDPTEAAGNTSVLKDIYNTLAGMQI